MHGPLGIDFVHRFPGGESRCDVLLRVDSFLDHVATHHPGRTVLIFAHMRTIAMAQQDLGQMPLEDGKMREVTRHIRNATPIVLFDPD